MNKKGFSLIELLAVLVILSILMLVAIPAIQRYIENSRRDTYISTLTEYVNAVRHADAGGYLKPAEGATTTCNTGTYYVEFHTATDGLLESGGKSPYDRSKGIDGYVQIKVDSATHNHSYKVIATDNAKHGLSNYVNADTMSREDISDSTSNFANINKPATDLCVVNINNSK